jgi:predicted lipoprotein with Yx(FWY)xxD motif
MRPHRNAIGAGILPLILILGACSSGATTAPASVAPSVAAPAASSADESAAASTDTSSPAASTDTSSPAASAATTGATVEAKPVGAIGTVLVAGSNGLTVYNFSQDVKDSGKSACGTGCIDTWPPLTVAAGGTPTGGTGVTGKLATITRDDGSLQVTYNGLPLYFFKNDKAPGDANGVYANWVAVKP